MRDELPEADITALTQQRDRLKMRGTEIERMIRAQQIEQLRKEIRALGEEPCR